LKRLSVFIFLSWLPVLFFLQSGFSQTGTAGGLKTVLIVPFENRSNAPGLEWISEAFPEVLGERLAAARLNVISRDDRNYAFDRSGIPTSVHPSRATLYRLAEQIGADYLVMGSYNYDGQKFRCSADVLDMKRLRLASTDASSGPLPSLIALETGLAWDVLKIISPATSGTREEFTSTAPAVRLDAFENYIRGVVATDRTEKVNRLREAVRLNPQYTQAMFALGRTYYDDREYDSAIAWLSRIPRTDQLAGEANFLLGLSNYYSGNYDNAEAAFRFLESRLPLTEVENNLGVVAAQRGRKNAIEYFQKAVQADPNDADYRFNLALALYKSGDSAGAARQLREALSHKPDDIESRELLSRINSGATSVSTGAAQLPMERLKENYDESSYRQLALEIENARERTLANTDPKTHAQFHVERGREMLGKDLSEDAARQFREAVMLDPTNAAAHAGLARVAENKGDTANARREAETSLQLSPTADAYIVLGRLDLRENHLDAAEKNADHALELEPNNAAAMALKKDVVNKQTMP
jgi:tetratricopeptide (TPR) repeat protein